MYVIVLVCMCVRLCLHLSVNEQYYYIMMALYNSKKKLATERATPKSSYIIWHKTCCKLIIMKLLEMECNVHV